MIAYNTSTLYTLYTELDLIEEKVLLFSAVIIATLWSCFRNRIQACFKLCLATAFMYIVMYWKWNKYNSRNQLDFFATACKAKSFTLEKIRLTSYYKWYTICWSIFGTHIWLYNGNERDTQIKKERERHVCLKCTLNESGYTSQLNQDWKSFRAVGTTIECSKIWF